MEQLKQMKETLISCVQTQIAGHLNEVNTEELGEAIDMIKDLSEAIYYCTITEAMEEEEEKAEYGSNGNAHYRDNMRYYRPRLMEYPPPIEYYDPRYRERYNNPVMYANEGNGGNSSSSGGGRSGTRNYYDPMRSPNAMRSPMEHEFPNMMERDPYEGKSPMRRKMYMEGKMIHKDKSKQMQELENYIQELGTDLTEMIQDASPEEKQLLQQKISVLATKIK